MKGHEAESSPNKQKVFTASWHRAFT